MAFKTILLNLNETERNAALFEQAAQLARAMDAHIAGLYVIPAVQLYPSTAFEAMPVIFEAHRDFFQKRRDTVKSTFLEGLRRHDVRGDIAVVDSASPLISDAVIEHGRVQRSRSPEPGRQHRQSRGRTRLRRSRRDGCRATRCWSCL